METSGVMVLALNKHACADLGRQFRERSVKKTYEAVVFGDLQEGQQRRLGAASNNSAAGVAATAITADESAEVGVGAVAEG